MRHRIWTLVAVLMVAGVLSSASSVSAVGGRGEVSDVTVTASAPGVLSVSWSAPSEPVAQSPADYRVRWAAVGDPYLTWTDLSGNAFPVSESLEIENLSVDVAYRVQVRARYRAGQSASSPWSGPWVESNPVTMPTNNTTPGAITAPDGAALAIPANTTPTSTPVPTRTPVPAPEISTPGVVALEGSIVVGVGRYGGGVLAGYAKWGPGGSPMGSFDATIVNGEPVNRPVSELSSLVRIEGTHTLLGSAGLSNPFVFNFKYPLTAPFVINAGGRLFSSTKATVQGADAGHRSFAWIWNNQCADWSLGDTLALRVETVESTDARLGAADATLAALTVRGANVNGSFDPATLSYTAATGPDTEQVTISATSTDPHACSVDVAPADADADANGHQVNIEAPAVGETAETTNVRVTVTGQDNAAVRIYRIAIERPAESSDDATLATLEITDSDDAAVSLTPAFDSDTTSYASNVPTDSEQVTVTAAAAHHNATVEITPADADADTDGHQVAVAENALTTVTVTVTAEDDDTTGAYTVVLSRALAAFARIPEKDISVGFVDGTSYSYGGYRHGPSGIWSDGDTIWVSYGVRRYFNGTDTIRAFDLASGERRSQSDITYAPTFFPPQVSSFNLVSSAGLWGDGEKLWLVDDFRDKVYVFDLATRQHLSESDFDIRTPRPLPVPAAGPGRANSHARGLWSDGETLWVSDWADNMLYPYDLTNGGAPLYEDAFVDGVAYPGAINLEKVSSGWPHPYSRINGMWSDGVTVWVLDSEWGAKAVAFDWETITRVPSLDFTTLAGSGNNSASDAWSDGETLWVADFSDGKLYAYNMPSRTYLSSLELAGLELADFSPATLSYRINAAAGDTSTTVTAVAPDPRAVVTVLPADADNDISNGHQVTLGPGATQITVTVTVGITTQTYTISVVRP